MSKKDINEKDEKMQDAAETVKDTETKAEEKVEPVDNQKQSDDSTATEEKSETDKESEEKDPLAEANAKIEEYKDKYLRAVAEFDNFRKRTIKEKAELILNGSERTITTILPVLDDMERAVTNADKVDTIEAVKEGQELIYQKLSKSLQSLGLKKIETDNQDFNTDFHEAIAMVPGQPDEMKGKVLDCVQAGYMLNDKVIRHAKVAVAQ
jgi:molecular chaperone GrpE